MNELATKLRSMKNDLGLSNKELSDLSGVPLGTVNRILAGRVEMSNFQTVRDLVRCMGGSLDELSALLPAAGTEPAEAGPEQEPAERPKAQQGPAERPAAGLPPEAIHAYAALLQEKQNEIETKDRWLKRLFIVCCTLAGILIGILIFDLLNPTIGYFLR